MTGHEAFFFGSMMTVLGAAFESARRTYDVISMTVYAVLVSVFLTVVAMS